jgi:hypothetical protein
MQINIRAGKTVQPSLREGAAPEGANQFGKFFGVTLEPAATGLSECLRDQWD